MEIRDFPKKYNTYLKKLLSADPLTVGQGRQACGDCCPLPVSLPHRAKNFRVCGVPQLRKRTPSLHVWALISRPWIEPNHAKFSVNLRFLWSSKGRSSAWKNRLVKHLVKNHECAFRPRKYTLYVDFHRRNPKFSQSRKTFLRVSSMKMAFQMRFVEAKRKLFMCSF